VKRKALILLKGTTMASYTISGTAEAAGAGRIAVKYVRFTVITAGTLVIEGSHGADAEMFLFRNNGDYITESNNGGANGVDARIEVTLEPGTYFIAISEFDLDYEEARVNGVNFDDVVPPASFSVTFTEGTAVITPPVAADDDSFVDTAGSDIFFGLDGDDSFTVTDGAVDYAFGHTGNDTLIVSYGASTANVYTLNPVADVAGGWRGSYLDGAGRDVFFTSIENFRITTGTGADTIRTFNGNDSVSTGAGNDVVDVGSGTDSADGGSGDDIISADRSSATTAIVWNLAANSYSGPDGADAFRNFEQFGTVRTGSGNDSIVTGTTINPDHQTEFVFLGAGDDSATSYGGWDQVHGGAGNDTLTVDWRALSAGVFNVNGGTVLDAPGSHTGSFANNAGSDIYFTGIERFIVLTGSGNDNVKTGSGNDRIATGAGNDNIEGKGGDDVLDGGDGTDTVNGEGGDDQITMAGAGSGFDHVDGGDGTDTLIIDWSHLDSSSYSVQNYDQPGYPQGFHSSGGGVTIVYRNIEKLTVTTGAGNDDFTTGSTDDIVSLGAGDDRINLGTGTDTADGGTGTDGLSANFSGRSTGIVIDLVANESSGSAFRDFEYFGTITGSAFADSFVTLNIARDETFSLGAGDDSVTVRHGFDRIDGGEGTDTLTVDWSHLATRVEGYGPFEGYEAGLHSSGGGATLLYKGIERLIITTGSGNDDIRSGEGNDIVDAGAGNDIVATLGGDDLVFASQGYDVVDGGAGSDRLVIDYGDEAAPVTNYAPTLAGYDGYISNPASRGVQFRSIEHFTVTTGTGNDFLTLGTGDDVVSLGAGDDRLDAKSGGIDADGGAGTDGIAADLSALTGAISIDLRVAGDAGYSGPAGTRIVNFEWFLDLRSGSGNDSISTSTLALDDRIDAGGGDDSILVINGYDQVLGGAGNDRLTIDYSTETEAITNYAPTGGFEGYISNPTFRGVQYSSIESFDIRTGSGNDNVTTGNGDDIVSTGAGNDTVRAGGGNDELNGGSGSDVLHGGDGDDTLDAGPEPFQGAGGGNGFMFGEEGDDRLIYRDGGSVTADGGSGFDLLEADFSGVETLGLGIKTEIGVDPNGGYEGQFTDSTNENVAFKSIERFFVTGSASGDELVTGDADDRLSGGGGNDYLDGGAGDDAMDGGAGTDTVSYRRAASGVVVSLALAAPQATGAGMDTITGVENLMGSQHGDALTGDSGANVLTGLAGNDTLDGNGGADTLVGGEGDDIYIVDSSDDIVTENGGEGSADEVRTTVSDYALLDNVEILTYQGSGPASLRGNAANNSLTGGTSGDLIQLQDGGDDSASGGGGRDLFYFGGAFTAADTVSGGDGFDVIVLQGDYGGVTLGGNVTGVEGVSLQSGSIARWGQAGAASYDYDLTADNALLAPGVQFRVNGQSLQSGEDLVFNGAGETDGGTFLVYGGHGRDDLTGGSGNDIFYFEAGRFAAGDKVNGGAGMDAVVISGYGPDPVNPLAVAFAAGSFTGIEALSFNGRFNSDPSARPSYEVTLANGNIAAGETLIVNASSLGSGQSLSFDGSQVTDGRLTMYGGTGADTLKGGANADLIHGGQGGDTLTGGGGADIFQYRTVLESRTPGAADRILDFELGSDRIDLSLIDANAAAADDQAFAFIGSAAFSGTAGELRAAKDGTTGVWTIEGDVDGNGLPDFQIFVTATTAAEIGASDFIL
jgi:Ca2+-binding RTX toxin-like protein